MKKYLVGGAVRDLILNREINDRDYVVLNSTPQELLEAGFVSVGQHFPVFLHPTTREEYALARREISTGSKTGDFKFEIENVTLEEDLLRRDLTINAIAQDDNGTIIDPYNGRADIKTKTLRYVSIAFKEDPLRIFRVARLSSQLNFHVADETIKLMKSMVEEGLADFIPVERIKAEFDKAIMSKNFNNFTNVLRKIGLLKRLKKIFNISFNNYNFKHLDYENRILKIVLKELKLSKKSKNIFVDNKIIGQKLFAYQNLIIKLKSDFDDVNAYSFKNIALYHGNTYLVQLHKLISFKNSKFYKKLTNLVGLMDIINREIKHINLKNRSREEILFEKELILRRNIILQPKW